MLTSNERYVRFIASGENDRISKVKKMTVIFFDLLFRHPSKQRDENLSRERERESLDRSTTVITPIHV